MTVRVNKSPINIREKLNELERPIGLKGSDLMKSETVQEARDLVSAGRRNLIINGDMSVWQRGTAASTITSGNQYFADRWGVATAGSAQLTQEQSTDAPPGFVYSLKVSPAVADTLSAAEQSHITQQIEAQNATFLNWGSGQGTEITISFWAKSNQTTNKCLWLYAQDAGDHIARQFSLSQANVWEKFTFTIPPNPGGVIANDNGSGIYVRIVLDGGSSVANGSLPTEWTDITNNGRYGTLEPGFLENTANEFYLTGVQVEAGKNATEFEYRSYGEELLLCQRYFYMLASGNNASMPHASYYSSTLVAMSVQFPVTMRANPILYQVSGTDYFGIYANNTFDYFNSFVIARPTTTCATLDANNTGASGTGGHSGPTSTRNAAARLGFSSEF